MKCPRAAHDAQAIGDTKVFGQPLFYALNILAGREDGLTKHLPYHLQLGFTEIMKIKRDRTRVGDQEICPG